MLTEEQERWYSGGCSFFVVCDEADLYDESDTRELTPAGRTFVYKIYHVMSVKQMTVDIQAAIWPTLQNTCSVTQPLVGWLWFPYVKLHLRRTSADYNKTSYLHALSFHFLINISSMRFFSCCREMPSKRHLQSNTKK